MEKEIVTFIKKTRRRYFVLELLKNGIIIGCIGIGIGAVINLMSCIFPIYKAVFISIIIAILTTMIGILLFGVFHFPNKKKMALMIDQKGLEERLITSLELIKEEHPMKELQLKDTVQAIRTFGVKEKFPFLFPKKPFFFLIILLILFIVGAVLPSPKKIEALKNHKIEEQAKQEIKKVEKAYEKVEKVKHLDKELEKQFKKLLEQGKKELKKANSKEEIKKSMDRLKTKIRQELQQLEAGQELEDVMEATFSLPKPNENDKKGEKKESGTGNGKDGQKEGKLNGTKSSNSKGKGNGASQGKNGLGGKKNYGSKNGIEQENTKKENPEKITIPGKKKGKDENLTGKATKGESKQSKGGIGYGYRGESVDYNQVVGEYKQEAYEKLEKNQIPSDMKGVVKEYFDYLETGEKR